METVLNLIEFSGRNTRHADNPGWIGMAAGDWIYERGPKNVTIILESKVPLRWLFACQFDRAVLERVM